MRSKVFQFMRPEKKNYRKVLLVKRDLFKTKLSDADFNWNGKIFLNNSLCPYYSTTLVKGQAVKFNWKIFIIFLMAA